MCTLGQVYLGPQDRLLLAHFTDGETRLGHCLNLQSLTSHSCRMPWVNLEAQRTFAVGNVTCEGGTGTQTQASDFTLATFPPHQFCGDSRPWSGPSLSISQRLALRHPRLVLHASGPETSKLCVSVDRSLIPLSHSGL